MSSIPGGNNSLGRAREARQHSEPRGFPKVTPTPAWRLWRDHDPTKVVGGIVARCKAAGGKAADGKVAGKVGRKVGGKVVGGKPAGKVAGKVGRKVAIINQQPRSCSSKGPLT